MITGKIPTWISFVHSFVFYSLGFSIYRELGSPNPSRTCKAGCCSEHGTQEIKMQQRVSCDFSFCCSSGLFNLASAMSKGEEDTTQAGRQQYKRLASERDVGV